MSIFKKAQASEEARLLNNRLAGVWRKITWMDAKYKRGEDLTQDLAFLSSEMPEIMETYRKVINSSNELKFDKF